VIVAKIEGVKDKNMTVVCCTTHLPQRAAEDTGQAGNWGPSQPVIRVSPNLTRVGPEFALFKPEAAGVWRAVSAKE
jgi:hypothetical protein